MTDPVDPDLPSIRIDDEDTVVTLLADATAGDVVFVGGSGDGNASNENRTTADGAAIGSDAGGNGLEAAEDVPFGHKVALAAHDPGDEVRKYGAPIGVATEPIAPGEWVHTHNCESVRGRAGAEGEP